MSKPVSLRSQKGQMAIFLVMIFQVLFVFFAMTINVGLVVYDKINLQNATDIAAYYAAQKQSELLNQIGHVNYQMRQAYKLLTFRIRVIGSASMAVPPVQGLASHPIFQRPAPGPNTETSPFFDRFGGGRRPPAVCVGSTLWYEYANVEDAASASLCRTLDGFTASISLPGGGGGNSLPIVGSLSGFLQNVTGQIQRRCRFVGVLNWQLAASFLAAYKLESQKRMAMIDQLAGNLSRPAQEMTDFRGQSVYSGTLNTLRNNLTDAQAGTLNMRLINSLSGDVQGPCADPQYWLPKVETHPVVSYVRMMLNGVICTTTVTASGGGSNSLPPAAYMSEVGGRDNNLLSQVWTDTNPIAMGVEKNPWCMPYMGVKATTSPRKIFAPFGSPIQLQAEAFAKPFGGRIGPWYSKQWPQNSPTSQGAEKVDPLLPMRSIAGSTGAGDPNENIVNHSKYPGDQLGMNSVYSLGAMSNFWNSQVIRGSPINRLPPVFALGHYNHVGDAAAFEGSPDSLVRANSLSNNGSVPPPNANLIRQMEQAAIAPDLFDITYYSIEAQYPANYFNPQADNFQSYLMGQEYYLDLGASGRNANYNLVTQISQGNLVYSQQGPFYRVTDPSNMLTSWSQQKATDYTFPDTFGRCLKRKDEDTQATPAPSGCPQGGRSGYSVKIVSKKYLNNHNAELGGAGVSGSILNAPQSAF